MTHPFRPIFEHTAHETAIARYHAAVTAALLTPRWHLAKKLYHVMQQRHYATMADRYGPKP
jgi:hypothetical protein